MLYFYLITIVVKLSISEINEYYNINKINNKLFDNKNIIKKINLILYINIIIHFQKVNLGENEFTSYEFEYIIISKIQK